MKRKLLTYVSAFLFAPLFFAGCEKEETVFGKDNLDKDRPSVEIVIDNADRFSITFELHQSDDTQQFAFAMYQIGEDHQAPTPYDLITGNVDTKVTAVLNSSDYQDYYFDYQVYITSGLSYAIYAVAISSEGVLSEVSEQIIDIPAKIQIKEGYYMAQGDNLNTNLPGGVLNEKSGKAWLASAQVLKTMDADYLAFGGDWFCLVDDGEHGTGPLFLGKIDYDARTASLDGSYWNGSGITKATFGMGLYYYNQSLAQLIVLWGGGSGYGDVVISFDENGVLTDISECSALVHDYIGNVIGTYDILRNGKLSFLRNFEDYAAAPVLYEWTSITEL
ncbi:MAG: hypothetical protein ACI4AE_04810 [Candidatus Cryptobacteroides sp.]